MPGTKLKYHLNATIFAFKDHIRFFLCLIFLVCITFIFISKVLLLLGWVIEANQLVLNKICLCCFYMIDLSQKITDICLCFEFYGQLHFGLVCFVWTVNILCDLGNKILVLLFILWKTYPTTIPWEVI